MNIFDKLTPSIEIREEKKTDELAEVKSHKPHIFV